MIDEALERDPAWAAAEYLAQFRSDIESFVSREAVLACVAAGVFERPPVPGLRYVAFVDPSGGSSDSFSLAIAHRDADVLTLDCVREIKPPFSSESVVREFAATLKSYRSNRVVGDRYGGEWPREVFRKSGIGYLPSARPKSEIYGAVLPLLNSRRVELLDNDRLIGQLTNLERRTARGGRDSIDHPPGAHDDLSNAVAGVLTLSLAPATALRMGTLTSGPGVPGVELDPRTGRLLDEPERTRIKWITVPESAVGAMKGIVGGPERRMR